MRENQIQARCKPKFRITTTDSNHDLPVAPNRLNQQFNVSKINQVWLTDFTYIPTCEGFSYLCAFKDLCSRRIVGWAMSRQIDAQLAINALNQAIGGDGEFRPKCFKVGPRIRSSVAQTIPTRNRKLHERSQTVLVPALAGMLQFRLKAVKKQREPLGAIS